VNDGHVTDRLVAFAVDTAYADLTPAARAWAAQAVMDTIGVAVAGRNAAGVVETRDLVAAWGGRAEATVWGSACRVPAPHAGLVNATAARALDFDDVFDEIPLHPSASLVPAALAAGEAAGGGRGTDLLTAVAVGAETMIRLALGRGATDPALGRPPLSRILGPTVAAGRMLGLDALRMRHAMALGFCLSAGELQSYDDGALTIRLQQGFVTEASLRATALAACGITGPWDFLEGRRGLARVDGIADLDGVIAGIGETFHATRTELKPFACCRCSHPAIAAALELRSMHRLSAAEVAGVRITVTPMCAAVVAEPRALRFDPRTPVDAQFSLPYVVARAMVDGDVAPGQFAPDRLDDRGVRRLMASTEVLVTEGGAGAHGMIGPARVELVLRDGSRIATNASIESCRNDLASGGAERKFRRAMEAGALGSRAEPLAALLKRLETDADAVSRLVGLLTGDQEDPG
jgi:2-methylcitrate dehydratase PrpD